MNWVEFSHTKSRWIYGFPIPFFVLIFSLSLFAIEPKHSGEIYFPLEFPSPVSGSFTEFRNHSLHLGTDYKTYGSNGYPVLSPIKGYIDTISFSQKGYGLSIVFVSPFTGYRSRVAHLHDFNGKVKGLEELRMALLLLNGIEGFQIKLKNTDFKVNGGERVARSGETGSGISHLHLEVWDGNGFWNPLIFPNIKPEDSILPVIEVLYAEGDELQESAYLAEKIATGKYRLTEEKPIPVSGNVRFRFTAYDRINARNKAGVFAYSLREGQKVLFEKNMAFIPFQSAWNREAIYDINRSSLAPSFYIYNLFVPEKNKNFSYNFGSSKGEAKKFHLQVSDASGNFSELEFYAVPSGVTARKSTSKEKVTEIISEDQRLSVNFKAAKTLGDGYPTITKAGALPEDSIPEGLPIQSDVYEVSAKNFTWKGKVVAEWKNLRLKERQSVYLYDRDLKFWSMLAGEKTTRGFKFEITRTGFLAVLQDEKLPQVRYPYLYQRQYNLPAIQNPNFLERFYSVSDTGSGVSSIRMEVLLDGQEFPFEYDIDRAMIRLEIPKKWKKLKDLFIVSIRVRDRAGNLSEWFNDVIVL